MLTAQDRLDLRIKPRGVTLIERDGTWHVVDWVGSRFYPNVADVIEEGRRMGFSRRISKSVDFSKLTRESTILLVHARAHLVNAYEYQRRRERPEHRMMWPCPKDIAPHNLWDPTAPYGGMCIGLVWEDVETKVTDESTRDVTRAMPSFQYQAKRRPDGVEWPEYLPAIFMRLPIARIAVVADPVGGTHRDTYERASKAGVPVEIANDI